jgi:hypothetical protein
LTSSPPRFAIGTLGLLTLGLAGSFFDWCAAHGVEVTTVRPFHHSVRGPKYVVKKCKTPVWSREDAKTQLDSIPKDSVSGLRDLALIATMFDSFARVRSIEGVGFILRLIGTI